MALISCPECNKEISDKAINCPHCGFPLPEPPKKVKVCPICGVINWDIDSPGYIENSCGLCENKLIEIDYNADDADKSVERDSQGGFDLITFRLMKQKLYEEYVQKLPTLDRESYYYKRNYAHIYNLPKPEKPDWYKQKMINEVGLMHAQQRAQEQMENQPHCPTCGSYDVQPIKAGERVASVVGLGFFSKKIMKTYKCKHCGYTW